MSVSVEDQLRQLGGAFDDLVDDVTFDEVARRADSPHPSHGDEQAARRTSRRLLLVAATFVLVVGGIVAVSVARRGSDAPDLRVPGADLAPAIVPDGSTLTASLATEFGWFELHEHPDGDRRCLTLRTEVESYGDCHPSSSINTGSAVTVRTVRGTLLAWGLVPASPDSRVDLVPATVAFPDEQRIEGGIEPDADGIWFAEVGSDDRYVIVDTPCCQMTIPLPATEPETPLPTLPDDIVVPRASVTIEGARTSLDGLSIELFLLGDAPYEPATPCTSDYVARVVAQDEFELAIDIEARRPGTGSDDRCTAEGVLRRIIVPLDQMLLQRDLLINGDRVQVFDTAWLTFPMELPAGWLWADVRLSDRAPELMWEITAGPVTEECLAGEGGAVLLVGPLATFDTLDDIADPDGTVDVNGFAATFGEPTDGSPIWLAWQAFDQTLVLRPDERPCPDQPGPTIDDLVAIARDTKRVQGLGEFLGPASDAFGVPATIPSDVSIPVRLDADLDGLSDLQQRDAVVAYLNRVAVAVGEVVGPDVYSGGSFDYDGPVSLTLFGTDRSSMEAALDRVAADERDRITVVEVEFSANDNAVRAAEAERRLAAAGIEAGVFPALEAIDIWIETPGGEPDPAIEAAVLDALGDIEASIEFVEPMVPFDSDDVINPDIPLGPTP